MTRSIRKQPGRYYYSRKTKKIWHRRFRRSYNQATIVHTPSELANYVYRKEREIFNIWRPGRTVLGYCPPEYCLGFEENMVLDSKRGPLRQRLAIRNRWLHKIYGK